MTVIHAAESALVISFGCGCLENVSKFGQLGNDKVYIDKAVQWAGDMTTAQVVETGRSRTYWKRNQRGAEEGWINCATIDVHAMFLMSSLSDCHNHQ